MPKNAAVEKLAVLHIDKRSSEPLAVQVYDSIRTAILNRQLHPGERLPSTRTIAAELHVSRKTVASAFEQLIAEGYLEGRVGSGTRVVQSLPDDILRARAKKSCSSSRRAPSRRGRSIAATQACCPMPAQGTSFAFRPGLPAIDDFPFETWAATLARSWRNASRPFLASREDNTDFRPLQEAIASYLGRTRGVCCDPEQILLVVGSQQALDLAARVLLDSGDAAWVEDPGYPGARNALLAAGADLVPVPVDNEGINVKRGIERNPKAKLAYVTPSHQYPLGVTMTLARRLELIEWAQHTGAWIIEDDYDSEYRYTGWAPAPLQCLDHACRTIYVGTFSKVLLPSIRIGYAVVPHDLISVFKAARAVIDRRPNVEQAALAEFMTSGHFGRHLRHMRKIYQQRQAWLVSEIRSQLGDRLDVMPCAGGLHLIAWLQEGVDDKKVSALAAAQRIEAPALSSYALEALGRGGLVLGFGAVNEGEIEAGVARLSSVFLSKRKSALGI